MQLNPTEISDLIKQRIEQFEAVAEARNEGTVVSVTDGIVRIHGLSDAMQGEMLEFPGETYGMALNLERDSVGAVVLRVIILTSARATAFARPAASLRCRLVRGCLAGWSMHWASRLTVRARFNPLAPRRWKKWRRALSPVSPLISRSRLA